MRPSSAQPAWFTVRWTWLVPVLLLALQAVLLFRGAVANGVTNDEGAHLTAGYSYWAFGDHRLQTENGNLPQRWGALPLLAMEPHLDPDRTPDLWAYSQVWMLSDQFFFGSANPIYYLLLAARTAMMVWPLAVSLLVWCWARHLWGPGGGLLALAMTTASPTLLAHGALVTSDMTAVFWLLAATGAWWRCLDGAPSRGWLITSLLATGLAFVAKFSCVLLIPVYALLAAAHLGRNRERRRVLRVVGLTAAHVAAIWVTIWVFFGLRFTPEGPGMPPLQSYFLPWDTMLAQPGPMVDLINLARDWHLLPEPYIEGFAHVRHQGAARSAFLLGDYSDTGWWWFFPAAFLFKSTLGELLLVPLIGLAAWHRREGWRRTAPLLALGGVYVAFSLYSRLNIGHRHILPLYPILFILGGAVVPWAAARWRRALAALPALSLAGALAVSPWFLTYFNLPSGGSAQGWRKLVDSSVDWGQGLPALADWLDEHRQADEVVYLSYFGNDDPWWQGIDATLLAPTFVNNRPRAIPPLVPGLYCISATELQDVYSQSRGEWNAVFERDYQHLRTTVWPAVLAGERPNVVFDFGRNDTAELWTFDRLRFSRLAQYLRLRGPDAVVANSILVFRLDARETQTIADGSVQDMADLMEWALNRPQP